MKNPKFSSTVNDVLKHLRGSVCQKDQVVRVVPQRPKSALEVVESIKSNYRNFFDLDAANRVEANWCITFGEIVCINVVDVIVLTNIQPDDETKLSGQNTYPRATEFWHASKNVFSWTMRLINLDSFRGWNLQCPGDVPEKLKFIFINKLARKLKIWQRISRCIRAHKTRSSCHYRPSHTETTKMQKLLDLAKKLFDG